MSDTPIFDELVKLGDFERCEGPYYDDEHHPPARPMLLEDYTGDRVWWNGKRWCEDGYQNSEPAAGRAQCYEAWPPYNNETMWREVQDEQAKANDNA